ncbi:MAG: hypothetical protein QOJ06_2351 [Pseudonocardiales bacterium]|nr:hypothetical protein [Pseudonocardiales bacterium]
MDGLVTRLVSQRVSKPLALSDFCALRCVGRGTVKLLKLSGSTGMVGSGRGRIFCAVGQAAVVVPVTSFQVVNRTVISQRYSSARSW